MLDDLNSSKPKLTWCLGEHEAGRLVAAFRGFSELLNPIHESSKDDAMAVVAKAATTPERYDSG